MAEYFVIKKIQRKEEKIHWRLIDRQNPFLLTEIKFQKRFRLSKEAVQELCQELRPLMNSYHTGYSIDMQVLQALRILATGSFQTVEGDCWYAQTAQSTVSRSFNKVIDSLLLLSKKYIKFPQSTEELKNTSEEFLAKTEFPNVIGAIDCTHIIISKPSCKDWYVFMDRKHKFSINVQMVCDANMKILDIVARWPGSTHDAFIWQLSKLREAFCSHHIPSNSYLLGDNGYPLERFLLTPYLDPCSPTELIFNAKHSQTRNVIERCFGVLKSRFRILHESGGTLLYSPEIVCKITICAAILHNICLKHNIDFEADVTSHEDSTPYRGRPHPGAINIRNQLAHYFQENL